jgi:hypothetical protein
MIGTVRSQTEDGIPVDCSETSDGWRIPGLLASILTPVPLALAPTFDMDIIYGAKANQTPKKSTKKALRKPL